MSKIMVCRCEDVTLQEIKHALKSGYTDIESIKRMTGLGTGWCQGKACVAACASLVKKIHPNVHLTPFTTRAPFHPVALGHLAQLPDEVESNQASIPKRVLPELLESTAPPLPKAAEVVVIGAGIMGLSVAYHLALLGQRNIVVLDKSYLCAGASGRNGGGVRAQWSSETHIELMKESIAICRQFSAQMGFNVWFRQGGYLFLARDDKRAAELEKAVQTQKSAGLNTQMITSAAAQALVPELNISSLNAASYNPEDGVVFPWPFIWGYADACKERDVFLSPFTEVTGFELQAGHLQKVITSRGTIQTSCVILAAGAWSPTIAQKLGLELPNRPYRHEICSTESLKPFLKPLVADLSDGFYVSQSMRGELVGGLSEPHQHASLDASSSLRFLTRYSKSLLRNMPKLSAVKVLRQWAGSYDVTPDSNPIVGEVDEVPGLMVICGFMGYGFMMAPVMGKRFASYLLHKEHKELFQRWNLRRFKQGKLLEETMNLG